jgi:hypothetical protein
MNTITRGQLFKLAKKSKKLNVDISEHDHSFTISQKDPKTKLIVKNIRCFVSGQCLDLTSGRSAPISPDEAARILELE